LQCSQSNKSWSEQRTFASGSNLDDNYFAKTYPLMFMGGQSTCTLFVSKV
jgi:hypothetical protein